MEILLWSRKTLKVVLYYNDLKGFMFMFFRDMFQYKGRISCQAHDDTSECTWLRLNRQRYYQHRKRQ